MAASPAPQPFGQDMSESQEGIDRVYVKWTSAASGALTNGLTVSTGVLSVTHGATGVYTVVLNNSFYQSVGFDANVQQASYSASGACGVRKTGTTPSTGTFVLLVTTAAGAAVEPASGDIIELTFKIARYRSPV